MTYIELKAEAQRIRTELATCDDEARAEYLRESLMIVQEEMKCAWLEEDNLAEVA